MPGVPSKRLLLRLLAIVMVVFLLIGAWLYNRQDKEYPAIPDETTAGLGIALPQVQRARLFSFGRVCDSQARNCFSSGLLRRRP